MLHKAKQQKVQGSKTDLKFHQNLLYPVIPVPNGSCALSFPNVKISSEPVIPVITGSAFRPLTGALPVQVLAAEYLPCRSLGFKREKWRSTSRIVLLQLR